jgi:hypothetical protein
MSRRRLGQVAVTCALVLSSLLIADRAIADPTCDVLDLSLCAVNGGGIETGVTSAVLERARKGLDLQTGLPDTRVFEYTSVTACQLSIPGGTSADVPCVGAVQACAGNTSA